MDEAKQLLEDFAAGRLDARTFQARYLAVWRGMRDRGEAWTGEKGKILAALFDPAECFDSDLAPGEPTDTFTLDETGFRAEVLDLYRRLQALPFERAQHMADLTLYERLRRAIDDLLQDFSAVRRLDSLKQVALTFVELSLIMAACAVSGAAVDGSSSVRPIGAGSSASIASQIVSFGVFFVLLAILLKFVWWKVRREVDNLSIQL